MRTFYLLFMITGFTLLPSLQTYAATEITGTVSAKREGYVKVDFKSIPGTIPENGDRVDFKKMISGFEAKAGYGRVTQSGSGFVLVKVEKEPVHVKMIGVIQTTGEMNGQTARMKINPAVKELTGIITGIKDKVLDIEMSAGDIPESYDFARLIWDIDGEALTIGRATVQIVKKDSRNITARLDDGEPAVGMQVKIPHDQYRLDAELNDAVRSVWTYKSHKKAYEEFKLGSPLVNPIIRIRDALAKGADINNIWFDGDRPPLLNAVAGFSLGFEDSEYQSVIIKELIKAGPDRKHMDTALGLAVKSGRPDITGILLKNGARADAKLETIQEEYGYEDPCSGAAPLVCAMSLNHFDIVDLLLKAGADVNAVNDRGESALFFADTIDEYNLLVKAGADIQALNERKETPLFYAASSVTPESDEVVSKILKAGIDVNAENFEGETALFTAGYDNAKKLIAAGANIKHKSQIGITALIRNSASLMRIPYIILLLEAGADINATTTSPYVIPWSREDGILKQEQLLSGTSALMVSASALALSNIRILLIAGADAGLQNSSGKTALLLSKENGQEKIADLRREEMNIPADESHYSESQKERIQGQITLIEDIITLLSSENPAALARKSMEEVMLKTIGKKEQNDFTGFLLKNGVNPNIQPKHGAPPIITALEGGNLDIVPALLEAGVDINKPVYGFSILFMASIYGNTTLMEVIINKGADVNFQYDGDRKELAGKTPLILAADKGHLDAVSLLLRTGASANIKDAAGNLALSLAKKAGHEEIVKVLEPVTR